MDVETVALAVDLESESFLTHRTLEGFFLAPFLFAGIVEAFPVDAETRVVP